MIGSIDGVNAALQGLSRAKGRVIESAERIGSGDVSTESLVGLVTAATDTSAQLKNLEQQLDLDRKLLDILA